MIPRPPPATTTTDFIVVTFVIMIATIFVLITVVALALALFSDKDISSFIAIIADTMTTITAALVGFLAGRGSTRAEET